MSPFNFYYSFPGFDFPLSTSGPLPFIPFSVSCPIFTLAIFPFHFSVFSYQSTQFLIFLKGAFESQKLLEYLKLVKNDEELKKILPQLI